MEEQPKPTEAISTSTTAQEAKPAKEKKIRTEKQQAATAKALAAMTAARKERAIVQNEKKEEVKQAVKVVKEKIYKDKVGFVTLQDFESTKRELAELRGMLTARQQIAQEKSAAKPTERIVERVIERVPTPTAQQTKLSGHALLDKLFF